MSHESILKIIESQRDFFNSNRTKDIYFRLEMLKKLKQAILDHEDDIKTSLQEDFDVEGQYDTCGRLVFILDELNYFIKNLKRWTKPVKVRTSKLLFPGRSQYIHEPLGVTLLIAAWNAPYLVNFFTLFASIAAGNCTIIKPSELSEASSKVLAKIIGSVFDPAYCAVIEGEVEETTFLLQQRFDFICYTGSTRVGQIVYEAAAKHLTPVILELGGKSPCIVDETADLQLAAKRICSAKHMNAGQVCVAPDYILVHSQVKQAFVAELKRRLDLFYPNGPLTSPDCARIINRRHFDRLRVLLESIPKEKIEYGGKLDESRLKIEPTLINNVHWDDAIMQEEIFGPLVPILEYNSLDEVIQQIKQREKPLALYVYSTNKATIDQVLHETSSGSVGINVSVLQFMNKYLPFGGVGHSGFGRYRGKVGFESFSNQRAIFSKSRWLETNLFDPPYENKHKVLRFFMR